MSDPVTNVEIEDVLSSIRKLVSDGDKARTRDPAPLEPVVDAAEDAADAPESKPDKLVLTPAFLVVENEASDDTAQVDASDDHSDAPDPVSLTDRVFEDDQAEPQNEAEAPEMAVTPDPEQDEPSADHATTWDEAVDTSDDDEMWDVPEDTISSEQQAANEDKPSDRSSLVETIAELEAAVSSDTQDFEPDGSEDMDEAIAWPGSLSRQPEPVEDAEPADDKSDSAQTQDAEPDLEPMLEPDDEPLAFAHRDPDLAEGATQDATAQERDESESDVYEDDDLEDLIEGGSITLDDAALRALVSDVVREELTGPLGDRITRNVRKLVRREIYRILSSQDFD